ncbi:MAG: sigma-70 family RNA polymerase sigma factor [Planctomycetota bacterium]
MNERVASIRTEEFLAHSDFVRTLARNLIADEGRAEDVVQQTWVAALEHAPARPISLRAWLARVARNLVLTARRRERRLIERQELAAVPETVPSTAEIFEREVIRRRVIEAVVALNEPYRSAIILRYYERLPPREIARRLKIPVNTVRTHLQRGLALLRKQFDAEHGGDRTAWCTWLAPVAGLKLVTSGAGGSMATTTVLIGALAMSSKLKIGLVTVVLALGAGLALWQVLPVSDTEPPGALEPESPGLVHEAPEPGPPEPTSVPLSPSGEAERVAVEPQGTYVAGRVTDLVSGEPVKVYNLYISRLRDDQDAPAEDNGEPDRWRNVCKETIREEGGRFRIPLERPAQCQLTVCSSRYYRKVIENLVVPKGGLSGLEIQLDPGLSVSGRVVDDASGKPIEGAIVTTDEQRGSGLANLLYQKDDDLIHTASDKDGYFVLTGLSGKPQKIAAVHEAYAEGWLEITPGDGGDVEIRLKGGLHVYGQVRDDEGEPTEGVLVWMLGEEIPVHRPTRTGPDGRYRTPPARPGLVELFAYVHRLDPLRDSVEFASEWQHADLVDRDVEVNFGPLAEHITWRGTIYGRDGEPQPLAGVYLNLVPADYTNYRHLRERTYAHHADRQGRFELAKLLPGHYRVSVVLEDGTWERNLETIHLDIPGLLEKDIHLPLANPVSKGEIRGTVIDGRTGGPLQVERHSCVRAYARAGEPLKSYTSPRLGEDARFRITDLPAGTYWLWFQEEGHPFTRSPDITVGEGEIIDGIQLVVPAGGDLRVELEGFDSRTTGTFSISMLRDDGTQWMLANNERIHDNGTWERSHTLEPGNWTVRLSGDNLGFCERSCQVIEGRLTELVITPADLQAFEGTISMTGSAKWADGKPVSGATVHAYGREVPGLDPARRSLTTRTDSTGRYELAGLRPGTWWLSVGLDRGLQPINRDLVIPARPPHPYVLDFVLPQGRITGTLVDASTGLPFTGEGPMWWIFLQDAQDNRTVAEIQGGQTGERFELLGIPAGRFKLQAMARVHHTHHTAAFSVGEGATVDLGRLGLEPCGSLILKVTDDAGATIESYRVVVAGKDVPSWRRQTLADNRQLCDQLATGRVPLEISAEGFKTHKQEIELRAGEPSELAIVLK